MRKRTSRGSSLTIAQLAAFDPWWAIHPKRTNRKQAEEEWRRVNPDGTQTQAIMVGTLAQIAANQWGEVHFVPDPHRYLRNRRWTDEVRPSPIATPEGWPWWQAEATLEGDRAQNSFENMRGTSGSKTG